MGQPPPTPGVTAGRWRECSEGTSSDSLVPYQPDLFRTSDLSGRPIRHYVTRPTVGLTRMIWEARQRGNIIVNPKGARIPDDYTGYRSRMEAPADTTVSQRPLAEALADTYADTTSPDGTPATAPLTAGAGATEARPAAPAPPAVPPTPPPPPRRRAPFSGQRPPAPPAPRRGTTAVRPGRGTDRRGAPSARAATDTARRHERAVTRAALRDE